MAIDRTPVQYPLLDGPFEGDTLSFLVPIYRLDHEGTQHTYYWDELLRGYSMQQPDRGGRNGNLTSEP